MSQSANGIATHPTQGLEGRLGAGLRSLQLDISNLRQRQLLDFVASLVKWNGVYNLTSVRDPLDMVSVHLLDALAITALVDRLGGDTLLDVGSGAGIPAIPLAIARPAIVVRSVDAVAKKIGFQLHVKSALGLANLHPVHTRVETFALSPAPALIVSRAFADIGSMLKAVDHLADEDTWIIAMKGKRPDEELAMLPAGWIVERIESIAVPFLGAERCAVVLQRVPHRDDAH